jgi:hypothetical protein
VYEAVQEVAPPHARPRDRSARIGSICRVVAALVWVQAWVGAVGRVRNAMIAETLPFLNCGSWPCKSLTFEFAVFLVQTKSPAEDADQALSLTTACSVVVDVNHEEACRF